MMYTMALVGVGGALGSIIRFLLQRSMNHASFPYGTLAVNIIGCLVIGILWALTTKNMINSQYRLLLMTGVCGGFTTFSAFSQEGIHMLVQNRFFSFIVYTTLSVTGGMAITYLGYKLFNQ